MIDESRYSWVTDEKITVTGTAGGFTAAKIKPTTGDWKGMSARVAKIQVLSEGINYTVDGTTPTSDSGSTPGVGISLLIGQIEPVAEMDAIKNFKAVRKGLTNAVIYASFGF